MPLINGTAAEAGLNAHQLDRIRDRCQGWVDNGRTPAIATVIARRGTIAFHEAFGQRTPSGEALEVDSVYPIGSVTKPVLATAVMQLVEHGLLSLNRQVCEYIPELTGKGTEAIEVHHLLTHTSGFDRDQLDIYQAEKLKSRLDLPPRDATQHSTIHLVLNALYDVPCHYETGTRNLYCPHNYDLLGEIVRRISGSSVEDYCRHNIFEPLGMVDSSFTWQDRYDSRFVYRGEDRAFGGRFPEGAPNMDSDRFIKTPWPNGGINTTALDLAHFCQVFLEGGWHGDHRLLGKRSVEEMTSNQIPPGTDAYFLGERICEASWGYGWMIQTFRRWRRATGSLAPENSCYHSGMGGCVMWIDPLNEVIGVFLSVWVDHDMTDGPDWDFDLFQNMVCAAIE